MHVKSIWMNLGKTICYNLKYTPVRLHYVILPVFFYGFKTMSKSDACRCLGVRGYPKVNALGGKFLA